MNMIWKLLARLWELWHAEDGHDLSGVRARFVGKIREVKGDEG